MKHLLASLILLEIISLPRVNLAHQIESNSVINQKQTHKNVKESIQIALPDFTLVSLNSGGMTSGDFINLNEKSLIIAFGGFTKGIPLSEIKSIKFESGVLIPLNNTVICQPREPNCRKFPAKARPREGQQTWSDIPVTALSLVPGAKTALLNLQDIVSDEAWQNLINQSQDMVYIIDQIDIAESGSQLTIKATPIARKK
ncbi:hypothetical protein VB715_11115 [Crocosphaera sp. UHCC 0190]|uniref:hypothetical protein n=1 Tax=Crocosphaera sp. UHCC 0190 TaxID=3110246 RepID=UPI002B1E9956|nr:hypothetical protein [Crocosphaera sp. UHCC 0190]MEA5510313.1 hypothetical protein [Crocosphaera sp. UHCC 0190]